MLLVSVRDEREQSEDSRPFDGYRQCPLMLRAGAGNAAGQDFSPFRNETAKHVRVFVVDFQFLEAEFTDLLFKEDFSGFSGSGCSFVAVPSVHLDVGSSFKPV
jgi:hypothetical protein